MTINQGLSGAFESSIAATRSAVRSGPPGSGSVRVSIHSRNVKDSPDLRNRLPGTISGWDCAANRPAWSKIPISSFR